MGKPLIYQMLPRLWGGGRFRDVDDATFAYLKSLGISHVWYTGIPRHSTEKPFVKGNPGCPYSICDWYDVNPYLATDVPRRMEEFEDLVERTHEAGLKVIMDFIPNHVSRDYGTDRCRTDIPYLGDMDDRSRHWSAENDFYYYPGQKLLLPGDMLWDEDPARATGNRFSPSPQINDWYDTIRLNYCDFRTGTWDRMLEIVRFWARKGIDGFRCDMVEMVPPGFMAFLIDGIKVEFPEMTFIAEVYRKDLYARYIDEVGFDFLYDKSGLYDTLRAVVDGSGTARAITWNWQELGPLRPHMLNFLENHDEQRFASPFFGGGVSFAPLTVSLMSSTAPFMLYFGEEIGVDASEGSQGRTSIFDSAPVPDLQRLFRYVHGDGRALSPTEKYTLERFTAELNRSRSRPVSEGRFYDLCFCNVASPGFDIETHFAFLRTDDAESAELFFANFGSEDACADVFIPSDTGFSERVVKFCVPARDASFKTIYRETSVDK